MAEVIDNSVPVCAVEEKAQSAPVIAVEETKEIDIYRDTPVRLLGYANEVGESFRALTPSWFVKSTYGVASLYVLADTYDKGTKMKKVQYDVYHRQHNNRSLSNRKSSTDRAVTHAALDTLVWQALASVIVPGIFINRVCAGSLYTMAKSIPRVPLTTRKWLTTAIGLGCIPFIVHPIDALVHYGMDKTIRKHLDLVPPKEAEE